LSDPVRLRLDPAVGAALRRDLEAAARARAAYDLEAGLRRHVELTAAAPSAAARPFWAKALPIGAGALALAVTAASLHGRATSLPSVAVATPVAPSAASAASASVPSPAPTGSEPSPAPLPRPDVRKAATSPARAGGGVDGRSLQAAAVVPYAEDETSHLARARALARTDPAAALPVLEEGQRRWPKGLFSEEREALAIGCLVQLGRADEARTRADAFVTTYPDGPFAERVRRDALKR
jgi:hypothetical protein